MSISLTARLRPWCGPAASCRRGGPGAGRRRRRVPRLAARLLAVVVAGVTAAVARPAAAADLTMLPSPIDPDRITRLLDLSGASDDQRLAVDAAYTRYAERHRGLVRARVEAADPAQRSASSSPSPSAQTLEVERATVRAVRSALAALAREDEAFLAEAAAVLGEPGTPPLRALAADRQAAVLIDLGADRTGHGPCDLDVAALVDGLITRDDPRRTELEAAIATRLATWRARRVPLARDLGEAAILLRQSIAERLEELGREDFEALREAWHGAQAGPAAVAVALGRLHRETVEGIARDLPIELATTLRSRWRRAFGGALAPIADGPLLGWFEEASAALGRDPDVDPRLAARVEAERLAHLGRLHRIAWQLAQALEERDSSPAGYLSRYVGAEDDAVAAAEAAWTSALAEAAEERITADRRGRAAALDVLATAGDAALRFPEPPPPSAPPPTEPTVSTSITMNADGTLELEMTGLEPGRLARIWGLAGAPEADVLPAPIDAATIADWATRLGIGAAEEPIVTALHADYLDTVRRLRREGAAARARTVVRGLLTPGPDGAVRVPEAGELLAALDATDRAAEELAAADEALLEELALLAPPAPAASEPARAGPGVPERLRLERARARLLGRVPGGAADRFSPRSLTVQPDAVVRDELRVDLAAVLAVVAPRAPGSPVDRAILEWEEAIVPLLESLLAAEQARRRREIELVLAALSAGEDGRLTLGGLRLPVNEPDEDAPARRWSAAAQAVVAAGRRAREAVLAVLPEDDRDAFEAAWRRARYPRLHADAARADDAFRAALAAPGLDADRRARLEQRWIAYRSDWEAVTLRLVEADGDWARQNRLVEERRALNRNARRSARELGGGGAEAGERP